MKETVEWLCFVIGGILILTAVLTHIFKVNLGGASVEGQSNLAQKIIAFVAGWVFVIIGGTFHGVGMYLSYGGERPSASQQQSFQPSTTPDPKSDAQVPRSTRPVQSPPSPQVDDLDLSGVWTDEDGTRWEIVQTGNALDVTGANQQTGLTATGTGSVSGRDVKMNMEIRGMAGRVNMRVSSDARLLTGTYNFEALGTGNQRTSWQKVR